MPSSPTRSRSPHRAPSPTFERPLTPFSYLSSPAPDLASTLHTQSVEAADEANTDFLRDSLEALDQASQSVAPRAYVDTQRDPRLASDTHAQTYVPRSRQETADDLSRRERLQRVLARLNRIHEPQAAAADNAYGDRTPSPSRQSLYDWAPGSEEGNDDSELDAILAELRRQQPETSPEILRLLGQSQVRGGRDSPARAASYMRVNGTVETYEQMSERRRRERQQSLRNRALLQRARQESSPSSTERMLRYVMDRERSGMSEEEERARGSGWFRPTPRTGYEHDTTGDRENWLVPPMLNSQERDRQDRVDAFRRGYLAEHAQVRLPRLATPAAAPPANASLFLENALKYLSDLRSSRSYEDALATAIDNNLATKEFFADKHDDFVLDLDDIEQPPPSSWVQPGTIFEGHQHASSASMNVTHNRQAQPSSNVEQINPNYQSTGHTNYSRIAFDASRPWLSHQIPPAPRPAATNTKSSDPAHDHWPVRVTIHEIDWDNMTLQGTMEAYDVPQHPQSTVNILNPSSTSTSTPTSTSPSTTTTRPKAGKKHAPITTYLEGHILDHRTHSFLTPASPAAKRRTSNPTLADTISFPSATPHLDAQNWLALPPFNTLSQTHPTTTNSTSTAAADALARLLLSRAQLRQLNEEYIFMRWKERCFVHSRHDCCKSSSSDRLGDQDRGHGLTISGFYYVSLRRSDGEVEGLYFDPSSTPYQLLRLKGRAAGWGSFGLR